MRGGAGGAARGTASASSLGSGGPSHRRGGARRRRRPGREPEPCEPAPEPEPEPEPAFSDADIDDEPLPDLDGDTTGLSEPSVGAEGAPPDSFALDLSAVPPDAGPSTAATDPEELPHPAVDVSLQRDEISRYLDSPKLRTWSIAEPYSPRSDEQHRRKFREGLVQRAWKHMSGGSGTVPVADFGTLWFNTDRSMDAAAVQAAVRDIDTDGSGIIDLQKFRPWYMARLAAREDAKSSELEILETWPDGSILEYSDERSRHVLGFDEAMEKYERIEFFDLFKWRRNKQQEGDSRALESQLGMKLTPRGSLATADAPTYTTDGHTDTTPRRAYLDLCCKGGVLPVPIVRKCARKRPMSRTGSAARTRGAKSFSAGLEGGGLLETDKVSHLDLSSRLISEPSWPTKRPGNGSHPDTLWANDATSQTAPRSRVEIVAKTLGDHSLNLQSIDASNNRFNAELSAYVERAERLLQGPGRHVVNLTTRDGKSPTGGDQSPRASVSTTRPMTPPKGDQQDASLRGLEVRAELQREAEERRRLNEKRRRRQADRAAMLGADQPMKSVENLIQSLSKQQRLTTLDLSNNRIGLIGAKELADVLLQDTCKITSLSLAGNRLGDQAVVGLAEALGNSRALTEVNLSDCAIGCAGACKLAESFEYNQRTTTLDLSWNHIRARGGKALAQCIRYNQAITDLDLSWNGIGQRVDDNRQPGAEDIGGAIAANTILQRLDLAHNRVEVPGAFVIADGMDRNKTLTKLVMDGNPIGHAGGRELLRTIRELGDLRDISLRDCNIQSRDTKLMDFDPSAPSGEYNLDLSNNYDRAIVAQLLKVVKGSGGRDRWCEVSLALQYRGLPQELCPGKRRCAGSIPPYVCACMRPLHWSPNGSEFQQARPADWTASALSAKGPALQEKTLTRVFGPDDDLTKCEIPEICALIEGLLNGGHTASCPNCDDSAVQQPCTICNGWSSSWGDISTWLNDDAEIRGTCILHLAHEHAQRAATKDDVVSDAALSKLKQIIRDTRKGGTERPMDSLQGQAQLQAEQAREKTQKLKDKIMQMKKAEKRGMPLHKLTKLAMERADAEAQLKEEKEAHEKLQQQAEKLQSSSTTEAERKQQKAILDMTSKEFYFKADQIEDLLGLFTDERSKREAVIKLFERTLDTDALLEMVEEKFDEEHRKYIERKLGPLYRFDPKNPTGHYRLDLSRPFERLLANKMIQMSNGENEEREQSGLIDTSQRLNRYSFRNQKLDHKPSARKYGSLEVELPSQGIFEFDFTSTFLNGKPRPRAKARVISHQQFEEFVDQVRPILRDPDLINPKKAEALKKTMKGRYFNAKQVCRILHEAEIVPAYCYCMYCWNNVDMDHREVPKHPFELDPELSEKAKDQARKATFVSHHDRGKNSPKAKANDEPELQYEKQLCNRVFLPCQHMVACDLCTTTVQRKYHKCIFCEKTIEECVEVGDKRIIKHDYAGPRVAREFARLDSDGSGSLDRGEVELLITQMLGNKTTHEDIEDALLKMDKDGSGEVEQEEFAQWFRAEHADEHPAGPDVFLVKDRLDEMIARGSLPRPSAGDRDLALEIAVAMYGRCVDMLHFKRVVHFFANKERDGLYKRLGPLNAMNPMDPDGWWKINLKVGDERAVVEMLVYLAVAEPGENWLGERFGESENKLRDGWELPRGWIEEVPHRGFIELVYFTSAKQVRIDCRRALIPRCLVSEEISDLSELADPFALLKVKDKLLDTADADKNPVDAGSKEKNKLLSALGTMKK